MNISRVGKTRRLKQMMFENVVDGKKVSVFSLMGEYKKECETLGGLYVIVKEGLSIDTLPANNVVVYDFERYYDGNEVQETLKNILRQIFETLKTDTERQSCIILDITQEIFEYIQPLCHEMDKELEKCPVVIGIAFQDGRA